MEDDFIYISAGSGRTAMIHYQGKDYICVDVNSWKSAERRSFRESREQYAKKAFEENLELWFEISRDDPITDTLAQLRPDVEIGDNELATLYGVTSDGKYITDEGVFEDVRLCFPTDLIDPGVK